MELKDKKNLLIFWLIIILIFLILSGYYYFKNKNNIKFDETFINRTSYQEEIKSNSWNIVSSEHKDIENKLKISNEIEKLKVELNKLEKTSEEYTIINNKLKSLEKNLKIIEKKEADLESKYNEIKSFTRAICSFYTVSHIEAVKSKYFKWLRTKVKELEKQEKNINEFNFIKLPELIYSNCENVANLYKEKILIYLQSEQDIDLKINDDFDKIHTDYINNIVFNEEWIDKKQLSENKLYFDNYFFNTSINELLSIYFPYHMREKQNLENFYNNPILTLDEWVKYAELWLNTLDKNLKKIWINWVDQFRDLIKNNYNIKNTNDFNNNILKKYDLFVISAKNEWIDIEKNLSTLENFKKYLFSNEYKKLYENETLKNALNDLCKDLIITTILSNDYADWINKVWYWEQVFWNKEKWNNIFRLNFIYLLFKN